MNWKELLNENRERPSTSRLAHDLRSEFEKDYHRIIGSASFRRLQDKTQVFPLDKSDFIRTRLTHSLEVSSYARSLGQSVGARIVEERRDPDFGVRQRDDIAEILQCAGLLHDMGNPPFGHFGEICIRQWFREHMDTLMFRGKPIGDWMNEQMKTDLLNFEGNAQVLRLVCRLHYLIDEHGMNLTYGLLGSVIKYPNASTQTDPADITHGKYGYFYADRELFDRINTATGMNGHRSPLAYLLEAADDIAYKTADIEDAYKKGFIDYRDLSLELQTLAACGSGEDAPEAHPALAMLAKQYHYGMEHQPEDPELYAVQNWIVRLQGYLLNQATDAFMDHYDAIMAGEYPHDLFYGTEAEELMDLLGDMGWRYVFDSDFIYSQELRTGEIYEFLMNKFVRAALYYDTDLWEEKHSPMDYKYMSVVSDNYKRAYHRAANGLSEGERLYLRMILVTDFISGMTDSHARDFYQEVRGIRS